jgi:hypothetical protein
MSSKSQYGGGLEDRVKRPAAIRAANISKFSAEEAKRKSDLRKQRAAINKQVKAEMPDLMSAFSNMSASEQVPMVQPASMDQPASIDQEVTIVPETTMDQEAASEQDVNSLADQIQGMELDESQSGGKKSKRRQTKRRR